jgi:hypothetical protein
MANCISCLFQGDNNVDEKGVGKVFCMTRKKWLLENDSCSDFTEYADLSKEIRAQYAFEIRQKKDGVNKFSDIINQTWKAMLLTLFAATILAVTVIKIFEKYIF